MAESTSPSTYELPVRVGAAVVGAIAIGLFAYMSEPGVAPPAPAQPTTAPLNAAAAPVVMIETSGSGSAAQQNPMGGGPAPIGGGPTPAGGAPTPGFGGGKLKAG
ncbi:MAG: hypothetical protein ABIV13_02405 [Fimbriimonadales bacterium]